MNLERLPAMSAHSIPCRDASVHLNTDLIAEDRHSGNDKYRHLRCLEMRSVNDYGCDESIHCGVGSNLKSPCDRSIRENARIDRHGQRTDRKIGFFLDCEKTDDVRTACRCSVSKKNSDTETVQSAAEHTVQSMV